MSNQVARSRGRYHVAKVPLEERLYYAELQRENYQDGRRGIPRLLGGPPGGALTYHSGVDHHHRHSEKLNNGPVVAPSADGNIVNGEKVAEDGKKSDAPPQYRNGKSDADAPQIIEANADQLDEHERNKLNAHRMLRSASWLAMFYLVTTDVLGPFNAPYAFSTIGYVGGVWLYLTFGFVAGFCSFLLLHQFLRLDSDRYPIRSYGEIAEVLFGRWANHLVGAAQVLQLLFIIATNNVAAAQSLYQVTKNNLCFVVAILIFALVGMVVEQIQTLKTLSIIGSWSIFINVSVIIMSIVFIAISPPNYDAAAAAYGLDINPPAPVSRVAVVSAPLFSKLNGAMNMVFAWGGLVIFPEMMAEMRRPVDFWKVIICAECLIMFLYMGYGVTVYSLQGQYTLPYAFQGVSRYAYQTVGNALIMVTLTIASLLYGNIALKVIYTGVIEDIFRGPVMQSFRGRIIWGVLVIAFWALSFIIATAIPQVQTLQAFIGAALLLQFSYTLPPLMHVGMMCQIDAMKADGQFTPGQAPQRVDSGFRRWRRGFFAGNVPLKVICILLALAALATSGLGMWGAILSIEEAFKNGAATSFGCSANV